MITAETKTLDIKIQGRIQGVGFRPFIYRLASDFNLYGWVNNQTSHVKIHVEGLEINVDSFVKNITLHAPAISVIDNLTTCDSVFKAYKSFSIIRSVDSSGSVTEISPDLAICSNCLKDIKLNGRRDSYSFTNCTNCGPRFSIIKDLPYDRPKTTMKDFAMCPECMKEYESPMNRRFHAQPISCRICGPSYSMITKTERINNFQTILVMTSKILESGGLVAIKGVGGFHLACNPFNSNAVEVLRKIKKRDGKPFAVMFGSFNDIKDQAEISYLEEKSLKSVQAPIVILNRKQNSTISDIVTNGLDTIGCFLPYTAFHYMLMEKLNIPAIVLTSGNLSGEPLEIDNSLALERFSKHCDALLIHDRDIQNRTDDSVVKIINGRERLFRRSRGWAPESIELNVNTDGILAAGSELKTCFCIGKSKKAILSQHIGDLKNIETFEFYKETQGRYKSLFRFNPTLIAHDLHPDYLSTNYYAKSNIEMMAIQHHHAHIAACMAENGVSDRVIGFSFDGTGLGDDGNIWGGEIFTCNLDDYKRHFHFKYLPLPGGDKAVEEPWRMAVSALYSATGKKFLDLNLPFLSKIPSQKVETLIKMIEKKINSPLTSSIGRIFDAVAAMTELCLYSSFDAEAPMRLEAALNKNPDTDKFYPFQIDDEINMDPAFREITADIISNKTAGYISAKFHNTVVEIICRCAEQLRAVTGINIAALSGGVFMNSYLLTKSEDRLNLLGFKVISHSKVPSNDGGIALGQLAIAAHRREKKKEQGRSILCV